MEFRRVLFRSGWVDLVDYPCGSTRARIACLGNQQSAALSIVSEVGKRIWVSNTPFGMGSTTPDAFCQNARPANVLRAAALIGHPGVRASGVLNLEASYVRPDGQRVGTGRQIAAV